MAEEQVQMPAEFVTECNALVDEAFNHWKNNATEEQKTVGLNEMNRFLTEPEFMAAQVAEMNEQFTAADVNNDGLLDQAEYMTFFTAMNASAAARGNYIDTRPETPTNDFACMQKATPGVDGVSLADFNNGMGVWMARFEELKAQME